ncbi:MAG: preprotein translocase subunit Sec61beta [Fervidicoccaceae archaeon]
MSSRRDRKRLGGPLSAAGLVSFYEELEAKVEISPTMVLLLSAAFITIVVLMRALL